MSTSALSGDDLPLAAAVATAPERTVENRAERSALVALVAGAELMGSARSA